MATKPTAPKSKIEPPKAWSAKTDYGFAKTTRGVPLVRLEDVHAWLVESKDMPSASAAARVFSVFVSDSASEIGMRNGAPKVRSALHILDPVEHPSGYGEFAGRQFFIEASKAFPHVPHHRIEAGTEEALLYAMGLAAAYVWLRTSGDVVECDLNRQLDGYCPDGEFQSHAVCKSFLGRLVVSLDVAHALWDWGTVAEVVQLHAVAVEDAKPTTWAAFILHRTNNKGHAWTKEMRALLVQEEAKRKASGHTGIRKKMADELGFMTPSGLGDQIRKADTGTKSGRGRKFA